MKIIQITPSYKPAYIYGGPIVSVAKLCETLAFQSLDVEVLTTRANGKQELNKTGNIVIDGVKIQYFNRLTKDHTHFSPSLLWGLYKIISGSTSEVIIHIHSWWNLVAILSCLLAKIKKIPVVISPRGMLSNYTFESKNSLLKRLTHQIIGGYLISNAAIHATTDMEKDAILKIVQPKSINTIPNFVYFPPHNNLKKGPYQKSGKPFKLLFFSRVEEKKGLEILFIALSKCQFSWSLTVAGTGEHSYHDKLQQLVQNLGISDDICWIGHVQQEKKYEILANHQLMVLFSHDENFANVVLESLSVGTAVAISDKVGLAPFVVDHKLGWVTNLDPNSITHILTKAYNNPTKIAKIQNRAPSFIRSNFDEAIILEKYIQLYKNLN